MPFLIAYLRFIFLIYVENHLFYTLLFMYLYIDYFKCMLKDIVRHLGYSF